ncbi:hypothetical protein DPMN_114634 [Dreissena polymorpha]|uniref:Uncharacterized protein n=1 Tax=Dreissena polymorpha TaxID=45954 RepID=A0A9D4KK96_DREPO|nr:hypothetical protein DPMN_114634 [Dreissena polymorpha]
MPHNPGGHFHEDYTITVASKVKNDPPPGGQVFQPTQTAFNLVQDIIRTNTINVAKNAMPPVSLVFQQNRTIFKLIQDIIKTNLLTKFDEDLTINVSFRC